MHREAYGQQQQQPIKNDNYQFESHSAPQFEEHTTGKKIIKRNCLVTSDEA